ncbi:MAG: hypothetical protein SFX18_14175 [Pirellulales bacterium]|nr:hypothetical protein [Pirellulales bacterium]
MPPADNPYAAPQTLEPAVKAQRPQVAWGRLLWETLWRNIWLAAFIAWGVTLIVCLRMFIRGADYVHIWEQFWNLGFGMSIATEIVGLFVSHITIILYWVIFKMTGNVTFPHKYLLNPSTEADPPPPYH